MALLTPRWRDWQRPPGLGVEASVFNLVGELSNIPLSILRSDTRLLHDLGIGGDDAMELFLAYSREFHVDLNSFPFNNYFPDESAMGFLWFIERLAAVVGCGGRIRVFARYTPITIADLVVMAEAGNREAAR